MERRLAAVMFTDMAGYTALVQADERRGVEQRERYWAALERHHDAYGGTIVQRLGDGSMSMFPAALDGVRAAVSIQQELRAHGVDARIGLHAGEVIVESERLTGVAVNVAARVESFAPSGAVLLSDSVEEQLRPHPEVETVPLGAFRLKNVARPVELFAVAAEGLVVPDAASMEGKGDRTSLFPGSLPEPRGQLLGRDGDLDALAGLVRENRLVSITGTGGVGKTRVLVELGRRLEPEFVDAAFVGLAHVTAPEAFLPAVAEALDVKEAEGRSPGDGIVALVGDREALLLLDNLEQIVEAAPEVAWLADHCPRLRIVATSRTPLRVAAEREHALEPLALPASVALFLDRAPRALDPADETVAAVCRRLDGLPLALELAAARLRLLTPEALLERLDRSLDILTSGGRDSPERHQTLRATIDWSHSLLDQDQQRLFRRLAVFASGCEVEDIEAVCGGTLDELEPLVEGALVHVEGRTGRMRLLEPIREYARERLAASGEDGELALRHAYHYAAVGRAIRDGVEGADQRRALERGVAEESNITGALDTLLAAARDGDREACRAGLELCGCLLMYWHIRGKNLSAREYATAFLAADPAREPTAGRAGALVTSGLASWMLGELDRANEEWAEARRLAAGSGAERELAVAGIMHAIGLIEADLTGGIALAEDSIGRGRELGMPWVEGFASSIAGLVHAVAGDVDASTARHSEALAIQRRIGDFEGQGLSLGGLAALAAAQGDAPRALELYRDSLRAFATIGDRAEEARILSETAWLQLRQGDPALARGSFLASIQAYTDVGSVRGIGLSLVGLAAAAAASGRNEDAVRIAAAAEVYAAGEGIVNVYSDETPGREHVDRARSALAADVVTRAEEDGRRLTIDEAVALA